MNYWLMKSEPEEYSIDDLAASPKQTDYWDGVRNYQARNMMRDDMKVGDRVLFYHSNSKPPGVVGIAQIAREGYPDDTAFDPKDKHYDAKSDPDNPRWYRVDVKFERKLKRLISLTELKAYQDKELADFPLLRRGNRLSIMPVSAAAWKFILSLESI